MPDDEYVEAIQKTVEAIRSRIAALNADCRRRAAELRPISDEVQATLDMDGYLEELYIEPTTLTRYTHIELEDLITDVLRASSERIREVFREVHEQHLGPESPMHELLQ